MRVEPFGVWDDLGSGEQEETDEVEVTVKACEGEGDEVERCRGWAEKGCGWG